MATTSNAGSGMSFSNAQQGTRGMSASDWIRLQRLKGATTYKTVNLNTNKDIAPPQSNQLEIHNLNGAINIFPVVGTSKIRRTASNWTDFVASQTADYVLSSQNGLNQTSVKNTINKVCTCTTTTLSTKNGVCGQCNATTHVRIM